MLLAGFCSRVCESDCVRALGSRGHFLDVQGNGPIAPFDNFRLIIGFDIFRSSIGFVCEMRPVGPVSNGTAVLGVAVEVNRCGDGSLSLRDLGDANEITLLRWSLVLPPQHRPRSAVSPLAPLRLRLIEIASHTNHISMTTRIEDRVASEAKLGTLLGTKASESPASKTNTEPPSSLNTTLVAAAERAIASLKMSWRKACLICLLSRIDSTESKLTAATMACAERCHEAVSA